MVASKTASFFGLLELTNLQKGASEGGRLPLPWSRCLGFWHRGGLCVRRLLPSGKVDPQNGEAKEMCPPSTGLHNKITEIHSIKKKTTTEKACLQERKKIDVGTLLDVNLWFGNWRCVLPTIAKKRKTQQGENPTNTPSFPVQACLGKQVSTSRYKWGSGGCSKARWLRNARKRGVDGGENGGAQRCQGVGR